ncbi:hypothetical protein E2C01_059893 [Portunus trituberculatus]|uniref:Uncharacterized protein n=1 Tax=Portunus trituberculatus TaxID=210409 RepID=A0A5B7H910_PORTR|nr:hypothetical protein [Portunus trituberculatus]
MRGFVAAPPRPSGESCGVELSNVVITSERKSSRAQKRLIIIFSRQHLDFFTRAMISAENALLTTRMHLILRVRVLARLTLYKDIG